jgi:ketosteroid isomerase-like protein
MEPATDAIGQNMTLEYRDAPGFDATAERNRSLITDALERLLEGDSEALWRIFDSDITFYEASCLPYGGSHCGIDATKAAFARLHDCYSAMHSRMEAVLASRDVVIAYQTITFTAKPTGKSGTLTVCELFRFRDGKVIEWRAHYLDACLVASAFKN